MSIYIGLVNHDELFHQLSYPPELVNNFNITLTSESDRLNNKLMTKYEGDSLDCLPSCECQFLRGAKKKGRRCPHCHSIVSEMSERPIQSGLWMRVPEGVYSFVNPQAWWIMRVNLNIGPVNYLDWLTNPYYKPKKTNRELEKFIATIPHERSLNYFIDNFKRLITGLFQCRCIKGTKKDRDEFMQWIVENHHAFFSQYMPIPSKIGFVTEKTPTGIYTDTNMSYALDAIRTLSSIAWSVVPLNSKQKQHKTVEIINQMADYHQAFYKKCLNPKESQFRKHTYGTRSDYSGRAVITSIAGNHFYQEIHLPWALSVMMFKSHLLSLLRTRINPVTGLRYTQLQATRLHLEAISKYCPIINDLFLTLIDFTEYGISSILQRNPSLKIQSAQLVYITKIKTDLDDNTFSISNLITKGPNADYDGRVLPSLNFFNCWKSVKSVTLQLI